MKMMNNKGIIPINKPSGWTSFDVVNKIKHLLRQVYGKNMPKVGHLGTLDPMATGVLLVTIGSATKLFDLLQQKHKTYIAEFKFGEETDTLDSTGNILNQTINIPTLGDIESALPYFIGKISQLPPKYSAKSVNGKRAYDWPVIIRAVNTVDAMVCTVPEIEYSVLKKITERILSEVDGVCRVLYDLSPKPSATIEWE